MIFGHLREVIPAQDTISLLSYIEILKKYRKRAITLQTFFFQKFEKSALEIHIRNVMPKFESSRLNGVAVIAKIHIHTYTPTYYIHTAELK